MDWILCSTEYEKEQLHELPLQKSLANISSFVEELNIASVKIQSINKKQAKKFEHVYRQPRGEVLC